VAPRPDSIARVGTTATRVQPCRMRSRRARVIDLRSRAGRAPNVEVSLHDRGALAHAREAEMTVPLLTLDRRLLNPLPIVADDEPELPRSVMDSDVDPPPLRMLDGIAQRFGRDPVNFVADERIQIARLVLDVYVDRPRFRPKSSRADFLRSTTRIALAAT